jgi:hypothetical protein
MKVFLKITMFTAMLLCSFGLFAQTKKEQKEFKKAVDALLKGWIDASPENTNADESGTYVPEFGVRGKYFSNKKLLSLAQVATLVGEPVFKAGGPHSNDMEFKSGGAFGNYNPAFLTKLEAFVKPVLADKKFSSKAQDLYDRQFKNYMRSFWHTYQRVIANEKTKKDAIAVYQTYIKDSGSEAGNNMQEYFRELADEYTAFNFEWYEINTTAVFWVRRAMDGTDDEFYKLMRLVIETFDKSFLEKK